MEFVAKIEKAGPLALAAVKAVIHKSAKRPPEEAETLAIERYVEFWFTEDHPEAEPAFAEKRAPVFKRKWSHPAIQPPPPPTAAGVVRHAISLLAGLPTRGRALERREAGFRG